MKWSIGGSFTILGSLLIISGWQGFSNRSLWYKSFDFRFGVPVIHETLDLFFLGAGFLIAGLAILIAGAEK
jgi:hypothetical protein